MNSRGGMLVSQGNYNHQIFIFTIFISLISCLGDGPKKTFTQESQVN